MAGAGLGLQASSNDPRFETQVEVTLVDNKATDIARDVPGQFPFCFEVAGTGYDR